MKYKERSIVMHDDDDKPFTVYFDFWPGIERGRE